MPYADVRGARLYYERHGSGDPLLLITGWTISGAVFEPLVPLYEGHFDVILYDHRGSARSRGVSPTTAAGFAADAAGLLKALGVPCALAYGLSMGGMVAQELALRHPARVHGLVLGGTSPGGPFAPRLGLRDMWAIARGSVAERGLRAPLLFSPEFRREQPERVTELLRHFSAHRSSAATIVAQTGASAMFTTMGRLDRLRAPTLVMHGERDRLVPPAASELLASRIPGAELAVVRGAGHAYALERPQESLDLLLDWRARRLSRSADERRPEVALDR
jgi:3-oxoadipate enol-lactonase